CADARATGTAGSDSCPGIDPPRSVCFTTFATLGNSVVAYRAQFRLPPETCNVKNKASNHPSIVWTGCLSCDGIFPIGRKTSVDHRKNSRSHSKSDQLQHR